MSRNHSLREFVSERPQVLSVLWTVAVVGSTVGMAVSSGGGATSGP